MTEPKRIAQLLFNPTFKIQHSKSNTTLTSAYFIANSAYPPVRIKNCGKYGDFFYYDINFRLTRLPISGVFPP